MRNVVTSKNILGLNIGSSGYNNITGAGSNLKNVHLQYVVSPGVEHSICKVTGPGSFYLHLSGFIETVDGGRLVGDPVEQSIYYLPSGMQLIGFQQQSPCIVLKDLSNGIEIMVPSDDVSVVYSLRIEARAVVGSAYLDFNTVLPGRAVTPLL